jgi:hypothetical protein
MSCLITMIAGGSSRKSLRIFNLRNAPKIVPKLPKRAERAGTPPEGHSHIHLDFGDKKITMCKHIRFEQGIIRRVAALATLQGFLPLMRCQLTPSPARKSSRSRSQAPGHTSAACASASALIILRVFTADPTCFPAFAHLCSRDSGYFCWSSESGR